MKQPRFKDKETRTKEIQEAAEKVFLARGFLSTTISQVAKEAGVAAGTIYLYFQNKDDLYMSLTEPVTGDLIKRLIKFEQELDESNTYEAHEVIMGFMRVFYEWYKKDKDRFNIVAIAHHDSYFSRMSTGTLDRIGAMARLTFKVMGGIFQKAKKKGTINKIYEDAFLADLIYSTFLGIVQFEQNKMNTIKKDYIYSTLEKGFMVISQGISSNNKIRKKKQL